MRPIFAQGNARLLQRLKALRQAAQTDHATRVALRLQAIMLSLQGQTTGQIARDLRVDRTRVHAWIGAWNKHGDEGLLEGHRRGRPARLSARQREQLADILDRSPAAQGLNTGVWTSPLVAQVIQRKFAVSYHPGHVRHLLKGLNSPGQLRKAEPLQAEPKRQHRWIRFALPNLRRHQG